MKAITDALSRVDAEQLTAWMQFALSVLFTVGFFSVVYFVVLRKDAMPEEHLRMADMLFGSLVTILVQQSSYWFSRQRGQTTPPPEKDAPVQPKPPG